MISIRKHFRLQARLGPACSFQTAFCPHIPLPDQGQNEVWSREVRSEKSAAEIKSILLVEGASPPIERHPERAVQMPVESATRERRIPRKQRAYEFLYSSLSAPGDGTVVLTLPSFGRYSHRINDFNSETFSPPGPAGPRMFIPDCTLSAHALARPKIG